MFQVKFTIPNTAQNAGQAILPAAGFRAGYSPEVQSRRADWKGGCSQDWLPHLTGLIRAPLQKRITGTRQGIVIMVRAHPERISQTTRLEGYKLPGEHISRALLLHRRQRHH